MGTQTDIEWADKTFNPWEGCTKVSPGCTHCYAETRNHRFGMDNWGKGKPRRRTSVANWKKPLKWNKDAQWPFRCGICGRGWSHGSGKCLETMEYKPCGGSLYRAERPCIFPSVCDWLDDEVLIEWLADFLKLIHDTPNLDWLLLTKRPEKWRNRIEDSITLWEDAPEYADEMTGFLNAWTDCLDMPERGDIPQNVWIGVSVEDQQRADERIPELLKIPAEVRFLSIEPLLGPVDLRLQGISIPPGIGKGIHWVIVGGESGRGARPCNVESIRDIVLQCKVAGVPCFVKQLGALPYEEARMQGDPLPTGWCRMTGFREKDYYRKQYQLKHRKGGDPAEWPEDLRVREFPNPKWKRPLNH